MGYFPFFIELEGKEGLIVGGGRIAAHKIEKLKPYGAKLTVVAPHIEKRLKEDETLICEERAFADDDVEGKFFVIAATDETERNAHISELCKEKNILVNVVDEKEKCSFIFPSLVKEGKLSAGISTEGASPVVAAALRSRLASSLPEKTEEILDYLAQLRIWTKERIADSTVRADFLRETALLCMEWGRPLTWEETEKRLAAGEAAKKKCGCVTLVGAGCGAFNSITLKGFHALRQAEVLVYDDLLDERLFSYVSESCERIYVGKRSGKHSSSQEEINALLIQKAGEGKNVVRLKGGDPFVFGRGGEEILALREAGIEVQEIPGITSAVAAPASAGIPVTHRGISSSFHVITGHTMNRENGLPEDLKTVAALQGTCIFLMGLGNLEIIAAKLIEYGKNPETPAAVVQEKADGSTKAVRGTLKNIAKKVKDTEMKTPAVIVVGETAGLQLFES